MIHDLPPHECSLVGAELWETDGALSSFGCVQHLLVNAGDWRKLRWINDSARLPTLR
jgi:hypothetical protein